MAATGHYSVQSSYTPKTPVSHRCYFSVAHVWKVLRQEYSTNLKLLQVKQLNIKIFTDKYS